MRSLLTALRDRRSRARPTRLVLVATRDHETRPPAADVPARSRVEVLRWTTGADGRVAELTEHELAAQREADGTSTFAARAVPTGDYPRVAAHLARRLGEERVATVAVGLDRTAEWALWELARERPDVLVLSSVDGAVRVLRLLAAGREVEELREPVLLPRGAGPDGSGAEAAARVVLDPSEAAADGPWLTLDGDVVRVRTTGLDAADRASVAAVAARGESAAAGSPAAHAPTARPASPHANVAQLPAAHAPTARPPGARRVVVGPANAGGFAHHLARAVARGDDSRATSVEVHRAGTPVQASDLALCLDEWRTPAARVALARTLAVSTHVLTDAVRPWLAVGASDLRSRDVDGRVEGTGTDDDVARLVRADLAALATGGRAVGLLLDAAALDRWPDGAPWSGLDVRLFVAEARLRERLPGSTWLPAPLPAVLWRESSTPLEADVPVVVTTDAASAEALAGLAADGRIRVRETRPQHAPTDAPADATTGGPRPTPPMLLPHVLRGADVVVDLDPQGLGSVALAAVAAGRPVVVGGDALGDTYDGVVAAEQRVVAHATSEEALGAQVVDAVERLLTDRARALERSARARAGLQELHGPDAVRAALGDWLA